MNSIICLSLIPVHHFLPEIAVKRLNGLLHQRELHGQIIPILFVTPRSADQYSFENRNFAPQ